MPMHVQEEEDRQSEYLQAQIERARQSAKPDEGPAQASELHRDENGGGAPLQMALPKSRLAGGLLAAPKAKPAAAFVDDGKAGAGVKLALVRSRFPKCTCFMLFCVCRGSQRHHA